ncbi:MAG: recombinase zinc beta ribbon domain-containing protein [Oscillospiraceae bacterium]|nr:recombinase zinc beta ribbon domain-containing protein [Oscillospiraceae bacterium]
MYQNSIKKECWRRFYHPLHVDCIGEARLLYCADCGARLHNERGKSKGGYKDIYTCSSYRKHTITCTMQLYPHKCCA